MFTDLLCYWLECQQFTQNKFQCLYTPSNFHKKNQFSKKPVFPLSTLMIILDWYPYISLFPDLLCKFGLSVSGLRKIHFNACTPLRISTKKSVPKKPGFPLSALIILDWYPYVSLFPDLLCKFSLSVSGLRKIRLNAYTPCQISTKNQFPDKPGFPLSMLIILDWYPYVSLFPDVLCEFGSSVSGLRKIRLNAYTPLRISTKKSVPKQTRIPIVHVNNLRLVSLHFSVP